MEILSKLTTILLVTILTMGVISCKKGTTGNELEIVDSLEPVEAVIPVESGENVSLIVNINSAKRAYFNLELQGVESNVVISDGKYDGWCIDVFKSINSNGGTYDDVRLFSTDMVEKWMPINYLLSIQDELKANDEELTWLEIQLAVWSLRDYPTFNLNDVAITELPGQFHKDGNPLFIHEKVEDILAQVENDYKQFDYTQKGTKYAVVVELPVDVQTVFAVVEKN